MQQAPTDPAAQVVGRIPSGLFIVTVAGPDDQETGLLASWIQQCSFEPLCVTVAIRKDRYVHGWIAERPQLAVSVLAESQTELLKHFGRGFGPGEPAFAGLATATSPSGLTVLADAVGFFEGPVREAQNAGDHRLYLLEVQHGQVGPRWETERPFVHIRKSARHY